MNETILKQLIEDAAQGKPDLPDELANFEGGFSSPKVRRLLNALCRQPDTRYLEIGVHTGSTFIAATYGNDAPATCIDRWQMFSGAREQFKVNTDKWLAGRAFKQIDGDCFALDLAQVDKGVTVYFFDGDHSRAAQYQALTYYAPVLADQFVLVVDDFNWENPREETARAIRDLGWTEVYSEFLSGKFNGDKVDWWNGLYVGLIQK